MMTNWIIVTQKALITYEHHEIDTIMPLIYQESIDNHTHTTNYDIYIKILKEPKQKINLIKGHVKH